MWKQMCKVETVKVNTGWVQYIQACSYHKAMFESTERQQSYKRLSHSW